MDSHTSVCFELKEVQALICRELDHKGIQAERLNDNYIFVEYLEENRKIVRNICRSYNVRSITLIERKQRKMWRIHLTEGIRVKRESREISFPREKNDNLVKERDTNTFKTLMNTPIRIVVSGKTCREIGQRTKKQKL